jgi:hypothetical protein
MAENTINEVKREQEIGKVFIIQVIAGHWWLTSVILATCEVRRIMTRGQFSQIVHKSPYPK